MDKKELTCFQCGKQFSIKLLNGKLFYQRFKHVGFQVRNYVDIEQIPSIIYFCGNQCQEKYFIEKYDKKKY